MSEVQHFIKLGDLDRQELYSLFTVAGKLKDSDNLSLLRGKILALLFEQPSTRTRVSFEAAMYQLGGNCVYLNQADSQLGRNESISDTSRVMSRMVDAIALRTPEHERLLQCSRYATVPVINALSDEGHPCQVLADLLTLKAYHQELDKVTIAWSGDPSNVCLSYIEAAAILGFNMRVAAPPELLSKVPAELRATAEFFADATEAVHEADLVVTDVWVSMASENPGSEQQKLRDMFAPYKVDTGLLGKAVPGAKFTHCLPAHRGEEVSAEVLDGEHSIAWEAAENRLHAQKALLLYLLNREAFNALSS